VAEEVKDISMKMKCSQYRCLSRPLRIDLHHSMLRMDVWLVRAFQKSHSFYLLPTVKCAFKQNVQIKVLYDDFDKDAPNDIYKLQIKFYSLNYKELLLNLPLVMDSFFCSSLRLELPRLLLLLCIGSL
jgi:hypothetical protein